MREQRYRSALKEVRMKNVAMVMTIAIVMLLAPTMALAGPGVSTPIQGTYEMIAMGSCLHSTVGFNDHLQPNPGGTVWGASVLVHGTWTFDRQTMRGVVSVTNDPIDLPPFATPGARQASAILSFSYDVTSDNKITVSFDNTNFPALEGRFVLDHKSLFLWNANVVQPFTGTNPASAAICNIGRVLLKVDN
jgi:hypothetical protein